MDVQHPAFPGVDQERRQDPHVAGQGDHLDPALAQGRVDGAFVGLAVLAERLLVDAEGLDAFGRRRGQAAGVRLVGQDEGDLERAGRRLRRADQGLHVGAPAEIRTATLVFFSIKP